MRLLLLVLLLTTLNLKGQDVDSAMEALLVESNEEPILLGTPFKGTRIVNTQSLLTLPQGILDFRIMHRFGTINSGLYNFLGLDNAHTRLQCDYGVKPWLTVGLGRSGSIKSYGAYGKLRLFEQKAGRGAIPISIIYHPYLELNGLRYSEEERNKDVMSRLSYTHQLLIGRRFNKVLTLQLTPTLVHRNLAPANAPNDVLALGAGGRIAISRRVSLTFDYYYNFTAASKEVDFGSSSFTFRNPVALGVDIETGGHVFQLHFTNTRFMEEPNFITRTGGRIEEGDIYFGFNISRVWQVIKPAS